jgi:hypothetical protein
MVQKKAWYEADHRGMRELHSGRESWQLIKELVSNSFDEESATECHVTLTPHTDRTAELIVWDNGKGFARISDAWTLFASTPKRAKPTVRGRFNIGEKELLCTAQSAYILTSGSKIIFNENGRQVRKADTKGTTVHAILYLGSRQVENTERMLRLIIPPKNVTYIVNGYTVSYKIPEVTTEIELETVIWEDGIEKHPKRKTAVDFWRIHGDANGWLFEMGIPVQEIETPYAVNVLQKIPMPPNRDVVKDKYLQDIYTLVLNTFSDEVTTPSASWVHIAMEDKDVETKAVKDIIVKRYGTDKVVLWSNDPRANDKARLAGYEVVHGRTLSDAEREVIKEKADVQYSGDAFPTSFKEVERIPPEKWTEGMKHTVAFAEFLHNLLLNKDVAVEFYSDIQVSEMASYGAGLLSFNKVHCGNSFFDKISPEMLGTLLHEFSHNVISMDSEHSPRWYTEFGRLAGLATYYAATNEELRKWIKEG